MKRLRAHPSRRLRRKTVPREPVHVLQVWYVVYGEESRSTGREREIHGMDRGRGMERPPRMTSSSPRLMGSL